MSLFKTISKGAMVVAAAALLAIGAPAKPAAAQSQGTINTLIGSALAIGGLILYNNYMHKQQAANAIVGYTQNGGTIYGNGRVVMPNGQTYAPNAYGQYPNGQYAYYSPRATTSAYRYDYNRTGQYDQTGRHRQGRGQYNQSQYTRPNQYNAAPQGNDQGKHKDRGEHRGEGHDQGHNDH